MLKVELLLQLVIFISLGNEEKQLPHGNFSEYLTILTNVKGMLVKTSFKNASLLKVL